MLNDVNAAQPLNFDNFYVLVTGANASSIPLQIDLCFDYVFMPKPEYSGVLDIDYPPPGAATIACY